MAEFKCKPFAVPGGGDTITQEMCKALGVWLEENFSEFEKTRQSSDVFIKAVADTLEKSGINPEQLKQLREQVKEFGESLDRIKHENLNKQAKTRLQAIKDFVTAHHEELTKKTGDILITVEKDAQVITTTNAVTSDTSAVYTGSTVRESGIYYKRHNRQYIRDVATVRSLRDIPNTYEFWEEGSAEGDFAVVAESGLKPLVQTKLVLNQAKRTKVAGRMTLTEEVIMDTDQLAENLIALADDKLRRDFDTQLTTNMLTKAASYVSSSLDDTVENPNNFDAIAAGALSLSSLNFRPDVLILNPSDAYALMITKDSTGRYILPTITNGGQLNVLGLEVITSNAVTKGEFVIAEYGTFQVREGQVILRSGYNDDDFANNRRTFILEQFCLFFLPTNYTGSILKGNFATIKEALRAAGA